MICRRRFTFGLLAAPVAPLCAGARKGFAVPVVLDKRAPPVLRVGPDRLVKTLAHASIMVQPGATIEVDAGEYLGDVATWTRDDLTIKAVGGRVRLLALGAASEGKGIWVVRAQRMRVEGIDFMGARVPSRNGAGIRLERGSLHVRNCSFMHNEMGLLTNHDPLGTLELEHCEFAYNRRPDGHNHNLYVGNIASLKVAGCYFHDAFVGHLLKSRAARNRVLYNRLTDESDGRGSYELEFPRGGIAIVVGNLIAQNEHTENPHLISFGAEGLQHARNALYVNHNTLVDALPSGGVFLRVAPGADALHVTNNLMLGAGTLHEGPFGEFRDNFRAAPDDFADTSRFDFRLRAGSRLMGLARPAGFAEGENLAPRYEYVHPLDTRALTGTADNPGAFQSVLRTS